MRFMNSLNPFLFVTICLYAGYSAAAEQDPPSEVVKEVGGLWMVASPLWDAYSEQERAEAEARWNRIEEIGEDQASRALVVLYQQKAGVERPFTKEPPPGEIPDPGPDRDLYTLVVDSRDKAMMTMILTRDPRRVAKFLPILRERLRWLISYVPNDHGVSALDPVEISAVARYVVKYGNEEDRRLLKELGQKYTESSVPGGGSKAEAIREHFENAAEIAKHDRQGFPFIRPRLVRGAAPVQAAASEGAVAATRLPDSSRRSPSLTSQTQTSEPNSSIWWISASLAVVLVLLVVVLAGRRRMGS